MLPLSYVDDAKKPIAMLRTAMTGSSTEAPFPSHCGAVRCHSYRISRALRLCRRVTLT